MPRKISNFLSSVKNDVRLKILVAYSISSECVQVYILHTNETRLKEHYCTPSSDKPLKLAVAEHSISHNHHITTPDTKILSAKSGYIYRLIIETTELMLQNRLIIKMAVKKHNYISVKTIIYQLHVSA
jgi:hypothetical protein